MIPNSNMCNLSVNLSECYHVEIHQDWVVTLLDPSPAQSRASPSFWAWPTILRVYSDRMRCDFFAANNRIESYACVRNRKNATQRCKLSLRFYACVCIKKLITSWPKILYYLCIDQRPRPSVFINEDEALLCFRIGPASISIQPLGYTIKQLNPPMKVTQHFVSWPFRSEDEKKNEIGLVGYTQNKR